MRRFQRATFALSLLISGALYGQSESKAEMTVPNYPALTIIGSQTTEITKPGDFSALQATIVSPLVSNDGTIPSNLAVEFQPYFFNSERRTLDDYISMKESQQWLAMVGRNSKISLASNDLIASDSSLYSRIGIGYRTLLWEGKLTQFYTKENKGPYINAIENLIDALHADVNLDRDQVFAIYKKEWDLSGEVARIALSKKLKKEEKISQLESIQNDLNKKEPWVNPAVYNLNLRKGFFLEFATAASIDFKDRNIANSAAFQRWGVWLNWSYTLPKKSKGFYFNNLSVLTRLSNYSLDPTVVFDNAASFFDGGVNFQVGLTKRLDFTCEYILRYGLTDFSTRMGEQITKVASGTTESKFSATIILHITDNISTTFSYSLINGEQTYTPENIQILGLGLTAAILPLK